MPAAREAALGSIFSPISELSRRKSCIPPIFSMGKTAIAVTTIPMPPIHWRIDLHISIPLGISSSPSNTVDPVVVIPEVASNKASVILNFNGSIMKGTAENIDKDTQLSTVNKKASRARMSGLGV